jgi:polysaccharide export outer membrane protein
MARQGFWKRLTAGLACAVAAVFGAGCHMSCDPTHGCCHPPKFNPCNIADAPVPKELNKVSLPPYVIETPDILLIDAIRIIPLPPYRVEPLDVLYITGTNVFESNPINGLYPVDPDGTINLGPSYGGVVRVADMTTDEIQKVLQNKVRQFAKAAEITVSLAQSRGVQQIAGQHIVRPDGTVGLGSYGSVYVAGMTIAQAKAAIESHLAKYLYRPEVAIDVWAFNSKFYYVITDFAGAGEQVARLPHTGNETVLDAISQIGGLSAVSSKKIWVARPAPSDCGHDQILPVDWCGITRRGQVKTNYQLLPGDRVYILSQPLTKFDTYFARVLSPIQRGLGVTLLGVGTVRTIQNGNSGFFGNNNGGTTNIINTGGATTTTR